MSEHEPLTSKQRDIAVKFIRNIFLWGMAAGAVIALLLERL